MSLWTEHIRKEEADVQVLEKILEEIQDLHGKVGSECISEDFYMKKSWEYCLKCVEDIICKYVNNDWILTKEYQPEEGQEVWISTNVGNVVRGMYTNRYGPTRIEGFVCSDGFRRLSVVSAWQPYYVPEPYRPERSGKSVKEKEKSKENM